MRTMRWLLATGVAAAVGLGVAGCGDGGSPTGPPGGGGGGGGGGGITIGPAGGTVISTDGNFILTIPAGALDAATTVTVTKVDASTPTRVASNPLALTTAIGDATRTLSPSGAARTATTPAYITGTGYKVEPEALALKVAASVQIKFDPTTLPSGYDPQLLRIRRRDRTQDQWQDCTHTGLQGNMVQARVTNFATFALYGWPKPPTGSAGALIDAAGGTLTSADGNFTLTIPAGALDATTQVIVTKVDAASLTRVANAGTFSTPAARMLSVGDGARAVATPVYIPGTGYMVEPEGLALKVAASVQIKFDPTTLPSGYDPQLLRIRRRDRTQSQDQWQECTHTGVQGNQVGATTSNFSIFALYGTPQEPVGGGVLVGPTGGTVTSADGNFIITIPAGALESTTEVIVTKVDAAALLRVATTNATAASVSANPASLTATRALVPSSGPQAASTPVYITGTGYKVEPEDLALKQPASVQIKFDPAQLPNGVEPQGLRIQRRDRTQNQWQDCTHTGVQGNFVQASVDRFSTFALYGTPKEPPKAAVVHVNPGTLDVETGDVVQLSAQALDADGNVLDVPVTWSVDNPAVATVDATGLLTALTDGTTSITATAAGMQGSAGVKVSRKVASVTIGNLPTELIAGESAQLSADVRDPTGAVVPAPTVTWTSLNPGVATVDETGKVTGVSVGSADIIATSRTKADTASVAVNPTVAGVTISAVPTEIIEGESAQLVADVVDENGGKLSSAKVTWTSLTPTVATVDGTGKVTGVSAGSTSIVASSQKKSDTVSVTVSPNVASIVISGTSSKPLSVGKTLQLTATAYNTSGQVITATIKWTSSSDAIATVSSTGLVTGVGSGTAAITATAARATASVNVRVVGGDEGGEETTTGNNLSWPVVFADGTGLTGLAVATDPGVRPLTTETAAYAELTGVAPTDPMAAFFYTGNVVDAASGYYLQGTASTWRAQIVDGTGKPAYNASIYWGDNIAGGTGNLGVGHPLRVEVALSTTDGVSLLGYNMPYVVNASSPDEIQGTDGTTLSQVPLIYSGGATLIIEQLDGPGGRVISTVSSAEYKAEINVAGRIIYGAQFTPSVAGTYRLRFVLASGANVNITAIGNAAGAITIVNEKESAIEIQVTG